MKRHLNVLVMGLLLVCTTLLVTSMLLYANQKPRTFSQMEDLLEWEAETLLSDPHYAQQFIRTGPPELLYNCHGWTFAQGERAVTDAEVNELLQNGRYRKVNMAMPGDIVIYYDKAGDICHSGIIKATGRQGFILVESKWGSAGRFLHKHNLPQVQTRYEFYRRTSPGSRSARAN